MTTRKDRRVTIVVHTDGDLASRQYRVPVWAFEAGKWGALVVGLLVVLFFAFAGPIGRAAARVPGLERQVARLEEENSRVQQLAAALNRAEANYQELRTMLGVRAPREKGSAPTEDLVRAVAVRARPPSAPLRYEPGPAEPTHWPLDLAGFVTRGQVRPGDPAESHPGIDIAVPAGTAVRAAGGGVVEAAGTDPAYGLFVLLRHSSGYETMYGHASRLLAREGDSVQAGRGIALAGESGGAAGARPPFGNRRGGEAAGPPPAGEHGGGKGGGPRREGGTGGTGMRVVGDITADGVVKIEGTVVGTVRAGRQVLVGKGGEVEGDVISREAIIGGEVRGSIRADERIEIQSTSVVHGDVVAKRLLVQEGGEINGVVRMGEAALEAETVEKAGAQRTY